MSSIGQPEGITARAYELELTSPILLHRPGGRGEPKNVVFRLEKGSRVRVIGRDGDPTARYPYLCVHELWNHTFVVGKGHKELEVEYRHVRQEDDSFRWERVQETAV